MSKKKIEQRVIERVIKYDNKHWELLTKKRDACHRLLEVFSKGQFQAAVFGSVARGDVSEKSDIDLIIFDLIPSYLIENVLSKQDLVVLEQSIVMATPNHAIKGHLKLENDTTVSFPLVEFTEREREFYSFGGKLNIDELIENKRVVGIDKRLMLIEPTDSGHIEQPLLHVPIKKLLSLGFPQRLLEERIRTLKRRDQVGRTGVFLDKKVNEDEGFNLTLKLLMDRNPIVRKKIDESR